MIKQLLSAKYPELVDTSNFTAKVHAVQKWIKHVMKSKKDCETLKQDLLYIIPGVPQSVQLFSIVQSSIENCLFSVYYMMISQLLWCDLACPDLVRIHREIHVTRQSFETA